jgi:hypothetical protein
MKPGVTFRERATVLWHLNEGFTTVATDRGGSWDIPTHRIPIDLRSIGSRFVVIVQTMTPELSDSSEAMRAAMQNVSTEPLSERDV